MSRLTLCQHCQVSIAVESDIRTPPLGLCESKLNLARCRYAIIEGTPSEEDERNTISTFDKTHLLQSAFPHLRLAVFRPEKPYTYAEGGWQCQPCHVMVYGSVSFKTLASVFVSSSVARRLYSDSSNSLLAFDSTGALDDEVAPHILEKIDRLTLEIDGRIDAENGCFPRSDLLSAWTKLSWEPRLFLAPSNAGRDEDSFVEVLLDTVRWAFPENFEVPERLSQHPNNGVAKVAIQRYRSNAALLHSLAS